MKNLIITGTIILFICSCSQQQTDIIDTNSQLDEVRDSIEKAWAIHTAADIAGNAILAVSIFDDEGTMIEYGSPPIVGKEALESYEIKMFDQLKVLEYTQTIEGLTVQGDFAFQLGKMYAKMQMKEDKSNVEIASRYMASWKKQVDGSWRIHYFIYYP